MLKMIIKIKQGFIKFKRIGKLKHSLFELERIEVYPRYQKRGYGYKLFNMMLKRIISYRKIFCTVHVSNKTAHKFYEAMGMKMEAVIPNHYYNNEPEIVYSLYS